MTTTTKTNDTDSAARVQRAPEASGAELAALLGEDRARPWYRRTSVWVGVALVALLAIAFFAWQRWQAAQSAPRYVTEPLARGNLSITVTANGTLQPTRLVNIGSELSGTVARVLVDVNDRVEKGQVLVELDTTKLRDQIARSRAAVAAGEARVAQAAATVAEARAHLARLEEVQRLSGGKVPSQAELDTARAALQRAIADENSARANVADARAALRQDETSLSKASIRSSIDGVVLTRAVEPGQAVAASLQAVTLFTVAEDLTKMRLQVNVDEADVGSIKPGQNATFTVAAYPNRQYPARITRVAYGSTTTDNVVTYVTYLDVDNSDLTLRPGMTATATIAAHERRDVLMVPNAALRFTPASVAAGGADAPAPDAKGSSGGIVSKLVPRARFGGTPRRAGNAAGSGAATAPTQRQIWILQDGQPVQVAVLAGMSDGRTTEIVRVLTPGITLEPGTPVIVDQTTAR